MLCTVWGMAPMLDLQVWIGAVPVFPIRQALTASFSAASARPSAGTPGADVLPWIGWHGGADRQDDNHQRAPPRAQIPAASSPDPIERAAVLGPVKAKPCGWPRRRGQP